MSWTSAFLPGKEGKVPRASLHQLQTITVPNAVSGCPFSQARGAPAGPHILCTPCCLASPSTWPLHLSSTQVVSGLGVGAKEHVCAGVGALHGTLPSIPAVFM